MYINIIAEFSCCVNIPSLEPNIQTGVCIITDVNGLDIFGLDQMNLFQICDQAINTIFNQLTTTEISPENIIVSINASFPTIFGEGLDLCTKVKAHLSRRSDNKPIYRP